MRCLCAQFHIKFKFLTPQSKCLKLFQKRFTSCTFTLKYFLSKFPSVLSFIFRRMWKQLNTIYLAALYLYNFLSSKQLFTSCSIDLCIFVLTLRTKNNFWIVYQSNLFFFMFVLVLHLGVWLIKFKSFGRTIIW